MSKPTQSSSDAWRKPEAFQAYSFYSEYSNLYTTDTAVFLLSHPK